MNFLLFIMGLFAGGFLMLAIMAALSMSKPDWSERAEK